MDLRLSRRITRTCGIDILISAWKSNITEMQVPYLVKKKNIVRDYMGTTKLLQTVHPEMSGFESKSLKQSES